MLVGHKHYRTIWIDPSEPEVIYAIDQRNLPHQFVIEKITSVDQMAEAILEMHVRGAGLIGAAAGYGMYLAVLEASRTPSEFEAVLSGLSGKLLSTRPTAINLRWAVERQLESLNQHDSIEEKIQSTIRVAYEIANEDADNCQRIGKHGYKILEQLTASKAPGPLNILTHCNAGWLAFVDYGSATAPIYEAHKHGLNLHVWVDETRPRNQGAKLTAWELLEQGVPHTVISDNTGGHLMQHGKVDLVIVGSDRTTYTGDVANKIGTYLKALAANDNGVPFYVALPSSTFDWDIRDGVAGIPIEQRGNEEVKYARGWSGNQFKEVLLTPEKSPAANYAFDVTPARLVTGLITERGICEANESSILKMFPEKKKAHAG